MNGLVDIGMRVLVALILVIVGFRLIGAVRKGAGRSMERAGLEISLRKFLDALIYALLVGLLVFAAAETLGINITSMVAVVGSIGLAVSLAMQNTLGNFAGGVLLLVLKPFKVGDYISSDDGEGTVESIGLVYTTLITVDNRILVIPNNALANSHLINVTGMEERKLVLGVTITYASDLKLAKEVLQKVLEENPNILEDKPREVVVDSLEEKGVVLSVRGWTKTPDYWSVRYEVTEKMKLSLEQAGVEIAHYNFIGEASRS